MLGVSTVIDPTDLARVRLLTDAGQARRIRELARLSQSDIARAAGVTPACISRWESGDRTPTGEGAAKYLQVLDRLASVVAGVNR